jgi:AraC family transcriptional regulator, activator of mtrCDE
LASESPGPAFDVLLRTMEVQLSAFAVCEIGRGWRLACAPVDSTLIHFVLKGQGYIEHGTRRIPIEPRTIVLVPPGCPKSIAGPGDIVRETAADDACRPWSEGMVLFQAHEGEAELVLGCASINTSYGVAQGLFDHLAAPVTSTVKHDAFFQATFAMLLEELSRPQLGTTIIAESLMKQSVVMLLRAALRGEDGSSPSASGPLRDEQLARTMAAVITRPELPHTVNSLAAIAGMSRSSFAARFSKAMGTTPGEFVQAVRMRAAARLLLTTELPVKTLAAAVGYSSRTQFSRTFRERYGSDPTTYRLEALEQHRTAATRVFRNRASHDYAVTAERPLGDARAGPAA